MSAGHPPYKHDIFVSYASADNQPLPSLETGWVQCLIETLENILTATYGSADQYNLWVDWNREDSLRDTNELNARVDQSRTLLIILSPAYMHSNWCKQELACFLKKVESPESQESLKQIFIVEKTVHRLKPPTTIKSLVPYRFWYRDRKSRIRTRGLPEFNSKDEDYYNTTQDLAYDIIEELDRLKGVSDAS